MVCLPDVVLGISAAQLQISLPYTLLIPSVTRSTPTNQELCRLIHSVRKYDYQKPLVSPYSGGYASEGRASLFSPIVFIFMHSSRMHTAHCCGHLGKVAAQGGCLPRGVSPQTPPL